MSKVAIYWLVIGGLCLCYPPLLGFILGIAVVLAIWWGWFKLLGG